MAQYHARDTGGSYQSNKVASSTGLQDDFSNFIESSENNPVFARKSAGLTKQSKKSIKSHNDASLTSSLRGHSPKQSIYANNLAESRWSERAENAESHTESLKDSSDFTQSSEKMDCHANPYGLPRNDDSVIDSHEPQSDYRNDEFGATLRKNATSHNDNSPASSLRGHSPKQSIYANNLAESRWSENVESAESNAELYKDSSDSIESSEKMDCHDSANAESRNDGIDMDCHANPYGLPRNDGNSVDCHEALTSRNDDSAIISHEPQSDSYNDEFGATLHKNTTSYNDDSPTSSLRGDNSPKQSINRLSRNHSSIIDSKDSTHSKPKLLHLASDLHSGGAERVFYNTIEQTIESNSYEIFIASADKTIPFNIDKSHFLQLDDWNAYSKVRGVCKYIFNLRNYRLLKRFLFTHKIDIIHTQNYLSRLSPSVLFSLRKFKRKFPQTRLIFTQHGYGVCANLCLYNYAKNAICESCISKSKLRIAIDNCDRRGRIYSFLKALRVPFYQGVFLKEQNLFDKIIFVSEFQSKKHILEGYKSTAVIANPIEHRFYNPHIKAEDKQNLIVFFGRIAKEKNIPLLIRSFVRFTKTHKDYRLLIIGNGDEKDKCQRLAEELLSTESQGDSIKSNAKSLELSLRGQSPKRALRLQLTHTCKSIKNDDFINNTDSTDSIGLNHKMDCHDSANAESRNDFSTSSLRGHSPKQSTPLYRHCEALQKPKQSIRDYVESSDFVYSNNSKNNMDCHEFNKLNSRNDGNGVDCHEALTSRNDDSAMDSHEPQSDYHIDAVGATLRKTLQSHNDSVGNHSDSTNATNPIASQITFIPHLPPDELKEILKLAKITVLPSLLYETFGLSIVESILSGAVPIASDIGSLSETIERYYGVAFKNGDEVSLANAMEAVVCEYERHFKALLQARSKIISDIECKKYVSDLLNAYML